MGDGEWHVHKHRTTNKRRAWRKPHLAVDAEGFIVASELTDSSVYDATVGAAMIKGIETPIKISRTPLCHLSLPRASRHAHAITVRAGAAGAVR